MLQFLLKFEADITMKLRYAEILTNEELRNTDLYKKSDKININ